MNLVPNGVPSMRIIALPLARFKTSRGIKQKRCPAANGNTMLVYYHFDLVSPCGGHADPSWHKKTAKNVIDKFTNIWARLGKAPKGSWKLWTYELGERIADRIDFEELALRNVDPSLGPTVSSSMTSNLEQPGEVSTDASRPQLPSKIPLIFPPSLYPEEGPNHALHPSTAYLRTLLASRGPRHRRGFYLWMLIAPLTFPITLIPIIPNLPFFFCIWRSWSHFTAYRSSQYLSSLLAHGLIEPSPNSDLDRLYASPTLSSLYPTSRSSEEKPTFRNATIDRESEAESNETRSARILLIREAVPPILKMFHLPESVVSNIHRAMDQVRDRIEK